MAILGRQARSSLLIRSLKSPKWELDLYLYFSIIFLFPSSLSEKSVTSSFTHFWHWSLVKFIQLVISYLFFRAVQNFINRSGRRNLYLYQIALIGFVGGSTSTIVFYFTLNYSNFLNTERNYLSFLISNALMGLAWLPICCATSAAFRRFIEMNELLSSKLSIKVINEIKQSQLFKSAVENEDRITSNQIIKIIENSKGDDDRKNGLKSVGFKRGIKLFAFKDEVTKFFLVGIKSLKVNRYSIQHKPLNPLYFTFILTLIVALSIFKNDQSYHALVIVSYFAVYTYFFHSLQMIFYRKVKNWVWLATLCDVLNLLVLIATGYVLNEYYDFFATFNTSMTTTYITVVFLYFFLYFTGHISQSASIKYWEHKKNLEKYLNSDSFKLKILNQELEKDGLKWEQIIHGKLQSRMISKSVKEKSGSDDQFIAEIKDLITQSLDTTSKNTANPTQIIELVSKPWSAVIDIQSEIDQSIAKQVLSPSVTQTVTDVLEEAITNAVKHGGAERVWLVIKADSSNSLRIQVKNNGAPVGKPKRQSIGTKLFNQSGIWSIGNESGLVVFKIQIDI